MPWILEKNWVPHINLKYGKKSKAVVRRCSIRKVFLKISPEACNFIKKETLAQVPSAKVLRTLLLRIPLLLWNMGIQCMLDSLKDCYNCFLPSFAKKHLNEHIIYKNVLFLILKSFWNLSSLLYNLIYLSLLNLFLLLSAFSVFLKKLSNYFSGVMLASLFSVNKCGFPIFFMHPAVSHVFHGPGFTGSRFFRVQVFQAPIFLVSRILGSRILWVWVQVLEVAQFVYLN